VTDAETVRRMNVYEVLVLGAAFVPVGLLVVLSVQDEQREWIAVVAVTIGTLLCARTAAYREIAAEHGGFRPRRQSGLGPVVGVATVAWALGAAIFADFAAGVSLALGVEVVYLSAFWRHWLFFLPRDRVEPRWKSWAMLVLGGAAVTLVFTALCAVLLRQGHIDARAPATAGSSAKTAAYDPSASGAPSPFSVSFENAIWTVAAAVPVLDVPETLDDWKPRYELTGRTSGWLLLGYKLLVLLPLLGLLGGLLEELQGTGTERREASTPA
jgi:hypothetical protein